MHNELETTFIYITHDQTEAIIMGIRSESFIHLIVEKEKIVAKINSRKEPKKGDILKFCFGYDDIYLFDKESENAIV